MSRIPCIIWAFRLCFATAFAVLVASSIGLGSEVTGVAKRAWGNTVEGQVLSICADKAAYAPGGRISLNICLKNVGQEQVRAVYANPLAIYRLTVLFPNGKPVPLTLYGRRFLESVKMGSTDMGVLKPGEETCVDVELARLFDLSLAGKYTVSVQRAVWKDRVVSSTLTATSNKLDITIDESLERR